jgi:SAM-dependent MidA family methyltransferase
MLRQIIREKINREGAIPFETFMNLALYDPEWGYYMTETIKIGAYGDFYTSPHLHPIFGWLLAVQLDEMKRMMGNPDNFTVLEIGAGRGYLAEGILEFVQKNLNWKGNWKYVLKLFRRFRWHR